MVLLLTIFLFLVNSILAENDICSLTQGVTVTASSAGNVTNELIVAFNPQWQAIGRCNACILESVLIASRFGYRCVLC